jgi:hypothetical protein
MTKFPNLVAAVEAHAKHLNDVEGKDQWAIGAAVIKDCGGAGNFGARKDVDGGNKSTAKLLEAAASELAKRGFEYTGSGLYQMANTVLAFPASRRHPDVNFFCHAEAKNPDLLDWIVKKVGKEKLSGRLVREMVARWHQLQANKHREKVEDARAQKKAATTLEDKRAAAKRLKELGGTMPTPKTHLPAPDDESQTELAAMADILSIDADAVSVTKMLRANLAELRDIGDINPDFTGALIEHHENVVEVAKQIVSLLKDAKRGRFTSIEGGKSA